MSQIDKLIKKFFTDPTLLKYPEILRVLQYFGFEKMGIVGSHVKFKHPRLPFDLVIPVHKNERKDFYKREAKKYIRKIME